MEDISEDLRALLEKEYERRHPKNRFIPGQTRVPVTGKIFDFSDVLAAVDASLDFWLTAGKHTDLFESRLTKFIGMRHSLMVNSGSSANLVAISSLTSPKLGDRRLLPGDEVITVAAGFPTTVSPILQNSLTPVYVDIEIPTYVADLEKIESAISPKTKAIVMAHTLGNPFDLIGVQELAKKHALWLVEDNCDGLGGTLNGQRLGSFGDISTLSFYPAHHITTGEGGAILTKNAKLKPILESFRDWGRDCWCPSGCDNTCAKRYDWKLGGLPHGYDHKYTYSHLGYNLKSGDIQAAIGMVQLNRIDYIIKKRVQNWEYLRERLEGVQDVLILPEKTLGSDPSWFGFAVTVRPESGFSRAKFLEHLDYRGIDTRLLFGGNLLRQPAFLETPGRLVGEMTNSDIVMNSTFWVGVWPGLSQEMMEYTANVILEVVGAK